MSQNSDILTRGVSEILPSREALDKLMDKRKIRVYFGVDPTADSLHIGHFIGMRKLAEFQKAGHEVILLIGDFTAMIGDPTDKSAARQKLTKEQVKENLKNYKSQVSSVIDFEGENKAAVRYNSEWLSSLSFEDVLDLSSNFTVQQILERDMFRNRLSEDKPIYLHEFLYPLMQGYDSVVMDVDLEIGGNDQLFNMMAGRALMKSLKGKEKYVLTTKLLTDAAGRKMGKTDGNAISLSSSAEDIYGKIMAYSDEMILSAYELLTDLDPEQSSPLEQKKRLAYDVVRQIKGESDAEAAKEYFEKTFQNKEPEYTEVISLEDNLAKTVAPHTKGESISAAKRLIAEGGVHVNGQAVTDPTAKVQKGDKLKIGSTFFGTVK